MSKQIHIVGHCTGQLVWIPQKYLCLEDKRGLGAFKLKDMKACDPDRILSLKKKNQLYKQGEINEYWLYIIK